MNQLPALALAALCATKLRVQSAIVLVWLFTAVGIADLIVATAKAIDGIGTL